MDQSGLLAGNKTVLISMWHGGGECPLVIDHSELRRYVQFRVSLLLLCPREQLRSTVTSWSVCLSVRPTGYLRNHTRDLYQIVVHIAYVRGLVLLRYVYDRPHRLSPVLLITKITQQKRTTLSH